MDDLPRELRHLVFDYLTPIDFVQLESSNYAKYELALYSKVYFICESEQDIKSLLYLRQHGTKKLKCLGIRLVT